jgi:hypothetical protein
MAMCIPLSNMNERDKCAWHLPLSHVSSLQPVLRRRQICRNSTIADIAAAIEYPKRSSISRGEYWQRERPSSISKRQRHGHAAVLCGQLNRRQRAF